MNSLVRNILFLCLGLLLCMCLSAQNKDFASWNSFSLSSEVLKDVEVSLNQELRFTNNASYLSDYLTEIEADYKMSKQWKAGVGYRIQRSSDFEDGTYWTQRYYCYAKFTHKFDRLRVKFREQYQFEPAVITSSEWSYYSFSYLRHKLGVEYNINNFKMNPFVDVELYQSLNNPVQNGIVKQRYTVGFDYPLMKNLDIELMFRYQHRQDFMRKPKDDFICGVSLKLKV